MIVNEADIRVLVEKDRIFAGILGRLKAPPNWSRPPGFASLSKIILEQQVSLASAHAHFLKLHSFVGDFTPENLLGLTDAEMRDCQISRQKMNYLRALSEKMLKEEGFLDNLSLVSAMEAREKLTAIKGIGHWTTDVYLMFCLQEKDIFPVGDVAVVNTMRELTTARTREEMFGLAGLWQPLRSLATYFLWHHYLAKRNRYVPAGGYATGIPIPVQK